MRVVLAAVLNSDDGPAEARPAYRVARIVSCGHRYDPGVARQYLGAVPDDEWRALLEEHLERADAFRVHVPDGNGPLSHGRTEFMALPGVEVRPWSGMRDVLEIAGPLSAAARDLFLRMEPSIESFDPERKLWDYELVQNGMVILWIGDYHDLQVEIPS